MDSPKRWDNFKLWRPETLRGGEPTHMSTRKRAGFGLPPCLFFTLFKFWTKLPTQMEISSILKQKRTWSIMLFYPLWDHRPIPRQIVGFRRWLESTHRRDCRYLCAPKKNEDISFWYIGHQEHPHIGGAFWSVWHCWLQGDWTLFVVIVCISALCLLRRGGLAWIPL